MTRESPEKPVRTLGEIFTESRKSARVTIDRASDLTRIPVSVLSRLESGEYDRLPPDAYLRGIIEKYALFLGADPRECIRQYREELKRGFGIRTSGPSDLLPQNRFSARLALVSFGARECALFVAAGAFMYLLWQVVGFVRPPSIDLDPAVGDNVVARTSAFVVSGIVRGTEGVLINGERIGVDSRGKFTHRIDLSEGENIVEFRLENSRGKITSVTRRIFYQPK